MELKEVTISSADECDTLLMKLRGMQLRRELKLIRGSFDFNDMVDAEFKLKNSNDLWHIHCVERAGGRLKRIY